MVVRNRRRGATVVGIAVAMTLIALGLLPGSPMHPERGVARAVQAGDTLFATNHTCIACHNGLVTSVGEDVSIGSNWRASMMANSARDPYWHAAVRREVLDHPESQAAIEDECSKCHMPMARYDAHTEGEMGRVFEHLSLTGRASPSGVLAADGVSCALCHQITDEGQGTEESLVGNFIVDAGAPEAERPVYGPFEIDESRIRLMRSATGFTQTEATHIQESEFCASCHTLITHALGPGGAVIGELPEQVPYQEWLHSDYVETDSCQSCHMPTVDEPTPITSVLGEPREGLSRHDFRGSNFFMLRVLSRHREELGVEASPTELDRAADRTVRHLEDEASNIAITAVDLSDTRLGVDVRVENLAGHKLPTAYPSRRVWLELTIRDASGDEVFSSGSLDPSGAIRGNDNDEDPGLYEPHYREIVSDDQVQIWESILLDSDGAVTTGLLRGLEYAKDNRLLPTGFDKETAEERIAVHGHALDDEDFTGGGDTVRYSVDVPTASAPFTVEAVLWYQPIGYRWAENLRPYDAPEPARFVRYYTEMAPVSAVALDRATARTD